MSESGLFDFLSHGKLLPLGHDNLIAAKRNGPLLLPIIKNGNYHRAFLLPSDYQKKENSAIEDLVEINGNIIGLIMPVAPFNEEIYSSEPSCGDEVQYVLSLKQLAVSPIRLDFSKYPMNIQLVNKYCMIQGMSFNTEWLCRVFYNTPLEKIACRPLDCGEDNNILGNDDVKLIFQLLQGKIILQYFCQASSPETFDLLSGERTFLQLYCASNVGRIFDQCFSLGLPLVEQWKQNRKILEKASKEVDGILLKDILDRKVSFISTP